MWPVAPIGIGPDVQTRLAVIFTAGLVIVVVVLAMMVARLVRDRRKFVAGECPDDPGRSRALVLVHRKPDGLTVVDCSHWHDGRPDSCRQRCMAHTG